MCHICRDGLTKKSSTTVCEKYKNRYAYATSHLKCDNEGEPQKNTSFNFFVYFLETIDSWKGRFVPLRFCNVPLLVVHGENGLESIKFQLMSHIEMAWLKKAVQLCVENTKIGAYATSHLKCDNEGEPRKKYIFQLLCLVLETIDSWKGRFVPLRICNVPILVVNGENGLESIKFQLMSHICRDGLTKKSSTPACGKYKNRCLCNIPFKMW